MKMYGGTFWTIIAALLFFSSCSGQVSAPPIDLPAPITGRIDVSAPDDSGTVTIAGEAGAVTGRTTVIAVNETVAGRQSLRLLDMLIPSAYAQGIFPIVCSQAGRACTVANADGSFVIRISASAGDTIAIGLIDPASGAYISDLVRTTVPSAGVAAGGVGATPPPCAGLGLSGSAVDVAVVPGEETTIVLKQGSDTATNRITIGGALYNNTISIDGCYADTLAVTKYTDGAGNSSIILAATSSNDRTLWVATYDNGTVWNPTAFTLTDEPMQIMFVGNTITPIVVLKNATTAYLAKVSLSDGSISSPMNLGAFDVTSISDIDAFEMENGRHLGLVINRDTLNINRLTFFHADDMQVFNSLLVADLLFPADGSHQASFFVKKAPPPVPDVLSLVIASAPVGVEVEARLRMGCLKDACTNACLRTNVDIDGICPLLPGNLPFRISGTNIVLNPKELGAGTPVDIAVAADAAQLGTAAYNSAIIPMSTGVLSAIQLSNGIPDPDLWIVGSSSDPLAAVAVSNSEKQAAILDATTGNATFISNLFLWQ